MMSWVRTATALIGFGFTIVQFFDRMQEMPGVAPAHFPDAPRYLGLALIFCGVMALVISIWEYRWGLRYLWGGNFALIAGVTREGKQTPLLAVAIAPHPHRHVRLLCRAVSSRIATQARKHRPNRHSKLANQLKEIDMAKSDKAKYPDPLGRRYRLSGTSAASATA